MILLASILAALLVLLLLLQAVPTLVFARQLRRPPAARLPDEACPPTLVVLCLRGSDPFLRDCVARLLEQDYPNYHLRIVVDSREDPAWQVVQQVLDEYHAIHVTLEPLVERHETCSLKGSSLIQALRDLDEEYEAVALLDGDTIVHRTWLRELVAPLTRPGVGVSSGNRWYLPQQATWGSLVRYVWNAAAVVQMYWNRFTWGGSVALRAEVLRQPELFERWRTSLSTDTVIYEVIRRQGYETAFVPSLLMVNRESCTLPSFFRWVQRQLLVARLYHPGWPLVLGHGVLTTVALCLAFALLAAGFFISPLAAGIMAVTLAGYLVAMLGLFAYLEAPVRSTVKARDESVAWLSPTVALKALVAFPLTQFVYAAALLRVTRLEEVDWRGVKYRIEGARQVRMVDYRPFAATTAERDPLTSL